MPSTNIFDIDGLAFCLNMNPNDLCFFNKKEQEEIAKIQEKLGMNKNLN